MILRLAEKRDEDQIVQIYQSFYAQEFPLDFNTSFAQILAEQDGKVVGFGWLELNVEASIILDQASNKRDKFEAMKKIISYGELVAANGGFKQMHIFPKDERFSALLKKHLNFRNITGECLIKDVNLNG